jgi:hypothetical protein
MFQNKMSIDRTVIIIFTVITNLPCRVPRALGVVESGVLDTVADNLKVDSSMLPRVGERDDAFGVGDRGDTFAEGDCEASLTR